MSTHSALVREKPLATSKRQAPRGLGVFFDNRARPIHRWYSFVEGYSANLVLRALTESKTERPIVLDPFGGSGTTALAASMRGINAYYCEVNPYLAWVADTKVNGTRQAWTSGAVSQLRLLADKIQGGFSPAVPQSKTPLMAADARRGYFPHGVAADASALISWIAGNLEKPFAELATLACTTSLIPSSNMVRRTDLRRRTSADPGPTPFRKCVEYQLRAIFEDVEGQGQLVTGKALRVGVDVRNLQVPLEPFDLIVTSPPYLNGTNYCRNTKLELLALGFLQDERELAQLRLASVTAGINNVSSRRSQPQALPSVERIADRLDSVAYDTRIPALVRLYFSDMQCALDRIRRSSSDSARFLLDIGDSRFCGIYIPTHELLCEVASLTGWRVTGVEQLRKRTSFDGSELKQVLIQMEAVRYAA